MRRARFSKSIYRNLFVFFLAITFALEISAFTMLRWGQRTVQYEVERSAGADVEFIRNTLLGEIESIQGLMHQLINDETLTRFANLWMYLDASDYYTSVAGVKKRLATVVGGNSYISEATVYLPAAACAIGSVEYERTDALAVAALIRSAYDSSYAVRERDGGLCMSVVYPSNSVRRGVEPHFLLLVELDMDEIAALLNRFYINESEYACLVNHQTGAVVYSLGAPERRAPAAPRAGTGSFRGEQIVDGRSYYVIAEYLPSLDMSIERFVPMNDIMRLPRSFNLLLVGLSALLLLCMVGYSVYTYRSVKAPVQALVDAFHALELGHMDTRIDGRFSHEFSYLVRQFNQMVARLGDLIEKEYVSELYTRRVELKQLQSQINPHFLFNSFFMLKRLIQERDTELAQALAAHLGRYFQFITRDERDNLPLRDEMAHALEYAQIQGIRFENRMDIRVEPLPERCEAVRVPRLILQPLLENAIEHGLGDVQLGGVVRLSCRLDEASLFILVEDNGAGLSDAALAGLAARLQENDAFRETTALYNIHRRVRLRFGEPYGMTASRSALGGLMISLRLPAGGAAPGTPARGTSPPGLPMTAAAGGGDGGGGGGGGV